MSKYDVLKVCKLHKSKKNNSLIFRDKYGKIYFPAKIEKIVDELKVGKTYLLWIIKEGDKFGYCRTSIDGLLIRDYIDSLPDRDSNFYFNKPSRDVTRFTNDMFNNNKTSKYDIFKTTPRNFPPIMALDNVFNKHGIADDNDIFRFDLSVLDCYLYNLFNVIKFKG